MARMEYTSAESVCKAAVTGGAFGASEYEYNKIAFVERVLGLWATSYGNDLVTPTAAHEEKAAELYEFYVLYRGFADTYPACRSVGKILHTLSTDGLDAAYGVFAEAKKAHIQPLFERRMARKGWEIDMVDQSASARWR